MSSQSPTSSCSLSTVGQSKERSRLAGTPVNSNVMPSRSRPSRSLFAALPAELKRSIRTQTLDEVDSLAVKQELLLDALGQPAPQSNLLPTQPASPSGSVVSSAAATAPIAVDIVVATAVNAAPTGPAQTYQNIAESSAAAHKRSYDLVESPVTPASRKSDTLGSKKKKSQRPPNKGAVNKHLGHAWDCTGLVPRYASAQQVPLDLRKCGYSRIFDLSRVDDS
jgi:trimethylguanosine synthase